MPAVQNIKSDTSEKSPKVFLAKSLNMNVQVTVHKFNTFQMIVQTKPTYVLTGSKMCICREDAHKNGHLTSAVSIDIVTV